MFHQINELMELGMHPALQHPRRSQIRPLDSGSVAHLSFYAIWRCRQGALARQPVAIRGRQRPAAAVSINCSAEMVPSKRGVEPG